MNFDDVPAVCSVRTDKSMLDVPWILSQLNRTYWGTWLTLPTVQKAIDNSLCFGLYYHACEEEHLTVCQQIGFARVVTDYATFAWLCDVVIHEDHRKCGMAKFMMNVIMGHPDLKERSIALTTRDAHGLYEKFGFSTMEAMKRPGGKR